jgi:cell fate regulator YaaT (PSP1 superfamily)
MQTVEVRFKGTRKDYFGWGDDATPLRLQEAVIVEAERGQDLGRITAVGDVAEKKCGGCTSCAVGDAPPANSEATQRKQVVRRASQTDIRTANELRRTEEETRRRVLDRVRTHKLDMKVSDAEWQWDRNKLTIYFTAEQRVDFRSLVRDLASQFRTRIELRQIGVRDEAAHLGGVGRCGKEYCCSTWLTELSPVNLALAKDQHLSLNPSQISGGCGRLLCCLKYEHEFYVAARKRFPKEGKTIVTAVGSERVIAVDIFRERVYLRSESHGPRVIPLLELREEVGQLGESFAPTATAPRAEPSRRAAEPPSRRAAEPPDRRAAEPSDRRAEPSSADDDQPRRKRRRRRGRRSRPDGGSAPPAPES